MCAEKSIEETVKSLARRLDIVEQLQEYGAHRWSGEDGSLPVLHLDDVSGIPFVQDVSGVEEYQHRARTRARSEDLFVALTPQTEGYEEYCRSRLGLGEPQFVLGEDGGHGYAVAEAAQTGRAFESIAARAKSSGGLQIHPYMAIEPVWRLAARVAEAAEVRVEVIGPPPPALWAANDKAVLSEIVARVLSYDWIVETNASTDPAEMADHLARMAKRHERVGLKRARCASGLGNAIYDSVQIKGLDAAGVRAEVDGFLVRTEWPEDEEVAVVAWESTDCSPSTQLWIPPLSSGPPVLQGVYEQVLDGPRRIFVGSRPSSLPERLNNAIGEASIRVARALQSLGYVGRCSFDFIVLGDPESEFQAKITECNGRWGGTSTGVAFTEVLERLSDELFEPVTGRGRYVFYNVGPLARHGKLDVIAFGRNNAEAEESVHEGLPRVLGL
jgi:hypothetical protein